ncbi:hypothetical protein ORS3428_23305 [Mesorhizobium sp. ORS 3428]|nr:hypothetical protein ORS3428_23305 [Mesorhizobium sp. ORS 3428]
MSGFVKIVRHLDCQNSAAFQQVDKPRQQRTMIRKPLQHGVREDYVLRLFGRQSCIACTANSTFGSRARAASIIEGDESMPATRASG